MQRRKKRRVPLLARRGTGEYLGSGRGLLWRRQDKGGNDQHCIPPLPPSLPATARHSLTRLLSHTPPAVAPAPSIPAEGAGSPVNTGGRRNRAGAVSLRGARGGARMSQRVPTQAISAPSHSRRSRACPSGGPVPIHRPGPTGPRRTSLPEHPARGGGGAWGRGGLACWSTERSSPGLVTCRHGRVFTSAAPAPVALHGVAAVSGHGSDIACRLLVT